MRKWRKKFARLYRERRDKVFLVVLLSTVFAVFIVVSLFARDLGAFISQGGMDNSKPYSTLAVSSGLFLTSWFVAFVILCVAIVRK